MQVTVTQTVDFEELPEFLERLGADIEDLLHQISNVYSEAGSHFDEERFTAFASALEETRRLLARADLKMSELRSLSLNYQAALLQMETNNTPTAPTEEGGDV